MNAEEWVKIIIRGVMCLSGIVGNNWLVIQSFPRSRSQLRTNDILFINLAISNLITNYMVDLPDMLDFTTRFNGRQYCSAFNFCSDLSETSSIFTTMFITIFWHQKLVGSLKRGGASVQMDSIKLVAGLLWMSWIIAIVFSLPHFYFVAKAGPNNTLTDCMEVFPSNESKASFDFLYLILANLVPILGIMFATFQITVTLLQSQKRISRNSRALGQERKKVNKVKMAAEDVNKSNAVAPAPQKSQVKSAPNSGTLLRAAKSVLAVAVVFLICWFTHLVIRIISTLRESSLLIELASYIGALYTCIIPYIYLFGVRKLNCPCSS